MKRATDADILKTLQKQIVEEQNKADEASVTSVLFRYPVATDKEAIQLRTIADETAEKYSVDCRFTFGREAALNSTIVSIRICRGAIFKKFAAAVNSIKTSTNPISVSISRYPI